MVTELLETAVSNSQQMIKHTNHPHKGVDGERLERSGNTEIKKSDFLPRSNLMPSFSVPLNHW